MNALDRFPAMPEAEAAALVTLPQVERRIAAKPGQTLLSAALAAGIPYPHSCQSGRCGACKSALLAGSVTLGRYSSFALADEECASGLILACRAVPDGDVTVRWLDESVQPSAAVPQEAEVAAVERATGEINRIWLRLEERESFRFAAGQYLRLRVEDFPARNYSMASRPDEELVELHVRAVPGGRTSTHVVSGLRPGDSVEVEGPSGSGYLRDAHTGPIVAIGGGSGLAPVKSIVETALFSGMEVPIHLYFGARTEGDLYLVSHFQELTRRFGNFSFVPVVSRPRMAEWRTGYVSDAVAADFGDLAGAKAYVAGPPMMVEAAADALIDRGLSAANIHADVFFTPDE